MKRLLTLVLVVSLAGSFALASTNAELVIASASEQESLDSAAQSVMAEEEAPPELPGEADEGTVPAEQQAAESSILPESSSESGAVPEPVPEEVPYWIDDAGYAELIARWEAASAYADGRNTILNATLTIASAQGGIDSTIMLGERKIISSGTNAPAYDNAAGEHLTPLEGYPQAGSSSDRSVLTLVESREDAQVYEALFFFGSADWPKSPFTAFSTYVVLESEEVAGDDADGSLDAASSETAWGESDDAVDEGPEGDGASAKLPYSFYVSTFWNAYNAKQFARHITAAHFTVSSVGEDGTITGTVGSESLTIQGTSGEARVLTEDLPQVGDTSSAALLTFNGTNYDALFLFGEVYEGASAGSAIGGLRVALDPGSVYSEASTGAEASLTPSPLMDVLSGDMGTMALNPNSFYVGMQFTGYFSGNYWYWNGRYYGGVFGMSLYWDNVRIDCYLTCTEPMVYGPESVSYSGAPVYGTIASIDRVAGLVYVNLWTTGPRDYYQNLAANNVPVAFSFTGDITLLKSSANPSLTNGNACYDLAGAQYGLYRSWADASANLNRIFVFTTDSSGAAIARATGLTQGTYYIKELKAPPGYALDTTIYTVAHNSTLTTVRTTDNPLGDPTTMIVQKLDTTTGQAYGKDDPNGYLLADGEFTVRYWDAYYDTIAEAEAAGEPTRTWVFKTGTNGVVQFNESYFLSGDALFKNTFGYPTLPLGTVAIQETKAPPGYLLPSPNPVDLQQIKETGDPLNPVIRLNTVIVSEVPHEVIVEKVDSDTGAPIANTEFTLYKESTPGAGDWTEVSRHVTDAYGKCVFSPVAVGSYKLDETRSNPLYAEIEESGDGAHYFEVTENTTGEAQVFRNDLVQVSIDVYKKTIALTNTALDGSTNQAGNHVGSESYLYHFGAKNSSNVRVDEFVITDSLEYVTSLGYRMATLWTGTTPEGMDYDGLMHILYKTNMTSPSEPVSFAYNPMSANPYNANNPQGYMSVSIEPGWRVWQECVSTTTAIRLEVADLRLKEGEYIIGIRAVYGGVVKGFYTGKSWDGNESPQSYTGDRDAISTLADLDTYTAFELRDWSYEVVATGALQPIGQMGDETVMQGSIRADLFRNWGSDSPVLTDIAKDKVETRVIKTFAYPKESLGITPGGFRGTFFGLPFTGDDLTLILAAGVLFIAAGGILATARQHRRYALIREARP